MGGPTAVVVKATLVLATAALAAMLLRRASAAFRHLIWLLGLSACAALALLSPAAPTIAVDIPTGVAMRESARIRERPLGVARTRGVATTVVRVASGSSVPVAVTVESPTFEFVRRHASVVGTDGVHAGDLARCVDDRLLVHPCPMHHWASTHSPSDQQCRSAHVASVELNTPVGGDRSRLYG
jgi:hypothetical protein